MNAIEFGKFLASMRNEKKLTQEELAEKLFIDKRKVSRWECGMSIPDFETITKLCDILDVTPYEFSICKRLEKEKLSKKVINKFKNIKSFKNYKLKKQLLIALSILLGIFFILTTIYTIKYYGKVEIYEFRSLDDKYTIQGNYIQTNNYALYNINNITVKNNKKNIKYSFNDCIYEIYNKNTRILTFSEFGNTANKQDVNNQINFYYSNTSINHYYGKELTFKIKCSSDTVESKIYEIIFKLFKKYDNKLF